MGSVVTFWGLKAGQGATSSNLISVAAINGMDYHHRTLLSNTQFDSNTIEQAFINSNRTINTLHNYSTLGLDQLENLARSKQLSNNSIKDYTVPIFAGLDLLPSTSKPSSDMHTNITDVIGSIYQSSKNVYDLTLVDVHPGDNKLTNEILHHSDLIVVNLNQNVIVLKAFFELIKQTPDLFSKMIIVIGQYDYSSKYTIKNISRTFKSKIPVYAIPHNSNFMDACNEQQVVEFFLKRKNINSTHEDYSFMEAARYLNKAIFKALEIDHRLYEERED